MTSLKSLSTLGVALLISSVPVTVSAQTLEAAPFNPALARTRAAAPLYSGRSVAKMRRRHGTGSYTNGKPDGANTGSRKQTPTGGNPGNGDHS